MVLKCEKLGGVLICVLNRRTNACHDASFAAAAAAAAEDDEIFA
jgi:hypothetical protein